MSPELLIAGIVLLATAAGLLRRVRRADAAAVAAYRYRVRIGDQVMDDLDRWRADRKAREARESLATCNAIWQLPTIPQQRKETGQ